MTSNAATDIHAILAERGQIAIVWSTQDVREIRPDLTDDQCWEVIEFCEKSHDCNYGITWDTLAYAAEYLFDMQVDAGNGEGRLA